jgi:GT2 family glycosyltransferase
MREVDVVIVNWESRDSLRGCLVALQAQVDIEPRIVVVENASSDGSAEMVKREFPDVTLSRQSENRGYTHATNIGLAQGSGTYVLLCNPDCEPEPGTLAALVTFLDSNPGAGGAAPRLFGDDGEIQDFCYRFPSLMISAMCLTNAGRRADEWLGGRAHDRWARRDLRGAQSPVAVEHAGAACLLLRRDLLADLLDESMPLFFSDTDLSWHLHDRGYRIFLVPSAHARHLQGGSLRSLPLPVIRHEMKRGLQCFYRRNRGPAARAALAAILVGDGFFRAAYLGLRDRSWASPREEIDWLRLLLTNQPAPGAPWVE